MVGFDERHATRGSRHVMTVSLTVVVAQHSRSTPPAPAWLSSTLRCRSMSVSAENSEPMMVMIEPPSCGPNDGEICEILGLRRGSATRVSRPHGTRRRARAHQGRQDGRGVRGGSPPPVGEPGGRPPWARSAQHVHNDVVAEHCARNEHLRRRHCTHSAGSVRGAVVGVGKLLVSYTIGERARGQLVG